MSSSPAEVDTEADLIRTARDAVWRLSGYLKIKPHLILEMQNQFDTLLNQIPRNVSSLRRGPIYPRDVHNRLASLASLCRRFALGAGPSGEHPDPQEEREKVRDIVALALRDIVALFQHWDFPVDLTSLQPK